MLSLFLELAAIVLILATYTAYLGNLPHFDDNTDRQKQIEAVQELQRSIYLLDHDIIRPCERVQESLHRTINDYTHKTPKPAPRVRREKLNLFRYTPKGKAFKIKPVFRDENLTKMETSPKVCTQRSPLRSFSVNENRRYPARLGAY